MYSVRLRQEIQWPMLFGVESTDPVTFAAVTIVLGLAAPLATSVPGHKAARIEPMTALRCE
jgi:putative ABC transport system permease protein